MIKFNFHGTSLIFSTLLGGEEDDDAFGIDVDAAGNVYIVGSTKSREFPTTEGAFDTDFDVAPPPYGTYRDGFVTKLNSDGTNLVYSTYLGGPFLDDVLDVEVDIMGNVYVVGYTHGVDFPITSDAFDNEVNVIDGFLTKLNPSGSEVEYSTFLGGSGRDFPREITLNANNEVVIAGRTESVDFLTQDPLQPSFGGEWDGFIAKWTSNTMLSANAGPDQVVSCTRLHGTQVTLDGSDSSGPDEDPLAYSWTGSFLERGGSAAGTNPSVTLQIGISVITLVVNDGTVDSEPDTVQITVTCTPDQHIGLMIDYVDGLVFSGLLKNGPGHSLIRKLVDTQDQM